MNQPLYLIALLLPDAISKSVRDLQIEIRDRFGCQKAMRISPHVTLEAPFRLPEMAESELLSTLVRFFSQQNKFELELKNFGTFRNNTVFIEVASNLSLLEIQRALGQTLRDEMDAKWNKPFYAGYTPHVTIANRDVTPELHSEIWKVFKNRKFFARFTVREICLLKHDGQRWSILNQFLLLDHADHS